MRYWFGFCKHNEKEANVSIIVWLNVKIESLFTLDSSGLCSMIADMRLHLHFCTVTVPNDQLVHVEKRHHYCDFYLPWNFEKQMVPWHVKQWCTLQWSYEQTPLVPVSFIKICTALMGTQHPLMPTVNPSTIRPRACVTELLYNAWGP